MTHANDIINGTFELVGGLTTWGNFARIKKDRIVRGVDWRFTFFFSAWGIWNLFYYPAPMGQFCWWTGHRDW